VVVEIPTNGDCKAILTWSIEEGAFGDERLDGLVAIARGEAGPGGPFEVFATTYVEPPEVVVGR
jgi:hypothetical protein